MNQPGQFFHIGPWAFAIDDALALLASAPREPRMLDVAIWANAYSLHHHDNPNPNTIGLIGPAPGALDREYAMSTDLNRPLIIAQLATGDLLPAVLLIDGVHRLYRAWRESIPELPAYVLTVPETDQIRRDKYHGFGRTWRIGPR